LHDKLAVLGAQSIVEALARLPGLRATAQPEQGVTYAAKLTKEEARLDWAQPATVLARKIRAFDPVPGAWTLLQGESLKIWRAQVLPGAGRPGEILSVGDGVVVACGKDALKITELQKAGARRLHAAAFLAGLKNLRGAHLGD
jgi:methionyl-tRNA formyltransferase